MATTTAMTARLTRCRLTSATTTCASDDGADVVAGWEREDGLWRTRRADSRVGAWGERNRRWHAVRIEHEVLGIDLEAAAKRRIAVGKVFFRYHGMRPTAPGRPSKLNSATLPSVAP